MFDKINIMAFLSLKVNDLVIPSSSSGSELANIPK